MRVVPRHKSLHYTGSASHTSTGGMRARKEKSKAAAAGCICCLTKRHVFGLMCSFADQLTSEGQINPVMELC